MKKLLFFITLIGLGLHTPAQNFAWAKRMGGTGFDKGQSIAVDAAGNVYTTGIFAGTVDFDPGAGIVNITSAGGDDIFISKLDASGNFVWAKRMGGTNTDQGYGIAVDDAGNVYTTGCFQGTADFNPGAGIVNLTSTGGAALDIFVSKLDASGTFVWAKNMGGTTWDYGRSIAVDAAGNVYTTGSFEGTADFDPGAGVFNLTSSGGYDIFVAKLDVSGNFVWAKWIGADAGSIAVDASGNVYTSGAFSTTVDFDPGVGTANLVSAGNGDIFVSKLDVSGNFVWAKRMGGTGVDGGNSITLDTSGNVYVTGDFENTVDFDPGAGTVNLVSAGGTDIFISKLDTSGNFVWAKNMGGTGVDGGFGIAVDTSGNVYTTGNFEGTVDFDPGTGAVDLVTAGLDDIFVSKLDASGNFVWAKNMGGISREYGYSIAVDAYGNAYTTGYFRGTADFDPGAGLVNLTSAGAYEIFVSKLSCSSITTDIQTACDSLTWIDGLTYTSSTNTPTFTLTNAVGCDSLVTLNLTINSNTGINVQTACESFIWIDGITYTTSISTPTFTLTNAAGCDSVVTLNLTINNPTSSTDTQTACDSLTWIDGITYTSSTSTPTFTLINSMGCDSVVTLILNINNSNTGTDAQTYCDSLTWINGITYTTSTSTPTFTLTNAAGCDSVVTLNLTINNPTSSTDIVAACDSLTWIDGNIYTTSTNTPTFTLTNAAGCDSVVTLNLTINSNTGTDVQTACDSLIWIDGITYTTSTNTPTFTLTNAAGCDSVVTLNLTITSNIGTDVQTACGSLTWIDGITYTSSTNTPTDTLVAANGCDSIVTLNLTINNLSASYNFMDNGSGNYTFTNTSSSNFNQTLWAYGDGTTSTVESPNHTFSANGTYVVVLTVNDSTGSSCMGYYLDTILVTSVVAPLQCAAGFVMYPEDGDVIVVNSSTGTNLTYLWNFGDGDTSTLQTTTHIYAASGSYYLCLSIDDGAGCVDMYCDSIGENGVVFNKQTGFTINIIALPLATQISEQVTLTSGMAIYPNPTSSEFIVEFANFSPKTKINIVSIEGKVVYSNVAINNNKLTIDAADWSKGVYFVTVINDITSNTLKLIKE